MTNETGNSHNHITRYSSLITLFTMSASGKDPLLTIATTLAFVAAPLIYYQFFKKQNQSEAEKYLSRTASEGTKIKPPFPQPVRDMLSKARLAYLSTVDAEISSSHLSLMRFTYLNDEQDGEVVIMSTNMQTKKFEMLQKQKGVALLIHDFQGGGNDGLYSITLNGDCRIVTDPTKAEIYRQAHLKHNPDYPQFIVGESIAILCIDVKSARICNINDQVTKWNIAEAAEAS